MMEIWKPIGGALTIAGCLAAAFVVVIVMSVYCLIFWAGTWAYDRITGR